MSNNLDILDSELIELDRVLMSWASNQQMSRRDLESFRRGAIEKAARCGFTLNVLTYETTQEDVYAFEFEITGRVDKKSFDYDRMVHEVTNNILELPNQDKGFIKSPTGAEKAAAHTKPHKH
jgi:hypothetical protein